MCVCNMARLCCLYLTYIILGTSASEIINGSSHEAISRRIVKGFKVDIKSFPHAVFLYFDVNRPSACGSSLITVKTVVTSAHCMRELKTYRGAIHAYLGASVPLRAKMVRTVSQYKIHPKYNPVNGRNDLGIAKFNSPVPLGNGIKKISIALLPPKNNEIMYTAGWGKQWPTTQPDFSDSRHLTASKQRILSTADCLKHSGIKITPAYLCSLPTTGYHYRGDMGNGLVTTKPRMTLVGVVAFMKRDTTLYASLLNERKWVRETVQELYGKEPMDQSCC